MVVAPGTVDELADVLSDATERGTTVHPVGGGTHFEQGRPVEAATHVSTASLIRLVAHEPRDLTVTVQAGVSVSDLAVTLAEAGQCWPQAEALPGATVGGVVAANAGGRSRLRNGPVRDGLLEVVVVTGDGRVVKGGGKTVKGVAGYDIPRLMVGSLGALGVIAEVTIKLWPLPRASGWFAREGSLQECVDAASRLLVTLHRPSAVLVLPGRIAVQLEGDPADVVAPDGFAVFEGPPPALTGRGVVRVGVPSTRLRDFLGSPPIRDRSFEAQAGVGVVDVVVADAADVLAVRAAATEVGGHAFVRSGPADIRTDPWGRKPPGVELMWRIKAAFDPAGVLAPGRLVEAS
ncbi:MAG: FAD-binding protein [Actinobacteria bacterium]|nr:FAD-binding protein [Actinomycetota bacterium]